MGGFCMPTVRVIARLPDYPGKLVRELRARGFDVETRVASGLDAQAADLEIRLEHCPPENLSAMVSGAADHEAVCMLLESAPGAGGVRVLRVFLVAKDEQIQSQAYTPLPKSVVEMCTALLNKPADAVASSQTQLRFSPVVSTLLRNYATAARAFCVDRAIPRLRTQAARMGGMLRRGNAKSSGGPEPVPAEATNSYSDLVPSMFSLSDVSAGSHNPVAVATEPLPVPRRPSPSQFRIPAINWRLGSALIAAALLVSGTLYFAARHKGGSLSAAPSNVVEKIPSVPGQSVSVPNEIADESPTVKLKPTTTRSSGPAASWRNRSGAWEVRQFGDDVTVRRLKESTPIRSDANPKVRVVEN